jgi:hypothetical protein
MALRREYELAVKDFTREALKEICRTELNGRVVNFNDMKREVLCARVVEERLKIDITIELNSHGDTSRARALLDAMLKKEVSDLCKSRRVRLLASTSKAESIEILMRSLTGSRRADGWYDDREQAAPAAAAAPLALVVPGPVAAPASAPAPAPVAAPALLPLLLAATPSVAAASAATTATAPFPFFAAAPPAGQPGTPHAASQPQPPQGASLEDPATVARLFLEAYAARYAGA